MPDAEQGVWRTVVRRKYRLTRDRVRRQNQLESLLEEAHVKLSSLVSELFGLSARRMLRALADGETDPTARAALGDRRLVGKALDELQLLERHMSQLDQAMADLLSSHQDAVQRLAEGPGLGVESAHRIIAEVGAAARTFPSEKHLASWIGVCPGEPESAGVSASNRSPQGNRRMRRLLNPCAHAAVQVKGSIFRDCLSASASTASVSNQQLGRSLTDYRG